MSGIEVLASEGRAELEVNDLYVRGADLVADCGHAGSDRIAPQLYWRASLDELRLAARIELVISVRTELLDSAPAWTVRSIATGAQLLHSGGLDEAKFEDMSGKTPTFQTSESTEQLFVFRCSKIGLSYAEMVHPSDFVRAEVTSSGPQAAVVRWQLFPERLEKGVIRRGRICGWFLPVENDLETAVVLARQFVEEPLPLTT